MTIVYIWGVSVPFLTSGCTGYPQGQQILRYLEFCVNTLESTDSVAHNYLVTLYVRYRPDKLMAYLHGQGEGARRASVWPWRAGFRKNMVDNFVDVFPV